MVNISDIKTGINCFLLEIGKNADCPQDFVAETEINLPNSPDERTGKFPHIDVLYPFVTTTKRFVGQPVQQSILMQIDVVGEARVGIEQVDDIASAIINKFRRGAKAGNATVTSVPSINSAVQNDNEYRVSMSLTLSFVIDYKDNDDGA